MEYPHPVIALMIKEGVGSNPLCSECRQRAGHKTAALGPWALSTSDDASKRILFVGKVARGDCLGPKVGPQFEDVRVKGGRLLEQSPWAFYKYTREIITAVFGGYCEAVKHVSFTNLLKCNNESMQDTSEYAARDSCIRRNRFIWKEISLLRPRLAIFYTHTTYDEFLLEFLPSFASHYKDIRNESVPIGTKMMPWWERRYFDDGENAVLDILRIGHPMCKARKPFVNSVGEWIKSHMDSTAEQSGVARLPQDVAAH